MIHHVTRATRHLIFWALLIIAIGLTAVRLMLAGVDHYRANLETRIAAALGTPVKVGGLRAVMRGVTPELILRNLEINPSVNSESQPIRIDEIRWGLNLAEYLLHRELLPSSAVTLVGAELSVYRDDNGRFAIEGLKSRGGEPLWLLQGRYHLLNSRIVWQDRFKGGKRVVLNDTNIAVLNDGNRHKVNAITRLPESYGGNVKLVANIEGEIENPEKLTGNVFIEVNRMNVPEFIASYLPLDIHVLTGTADFKIWGQLQKNAVFSASGLAQLQDAHFIREGYGQFPVNKLATEFFVNLEQSAWRADFDKFELQMDSKANRQSKHWPSVSLSLGYVNTTGNAPGKLKIFSHEMDLSEAAQIAAFFLPVSSEQAKNINSSGIQGKMHNFVLYAEPETSNFAMAGQFDSISMQAAGDWPGFDHVNASVKSTENAGAIKFSGKDTLLNYGKLFAKPLLFNRLESHVNWRRFDKEWTIASDSIELDCPPLNVLSRVFVNLPATDSGNPFVDIQAKLKSRDLARVADYLPTGVMNPRLKTWFTNAFKGGKLTQGDFLWFGSADNFPFTDGTGVFQGSFDVENVQLMFHPDWQQINNINGRVTIDKDVIAGKFDGGQMAKVKINPTAMLISGLGGDVQLNIKGEGTGEINDVLDILEHSPISAKVLPVLNNTKITGVTKGWLDLTVPFTAGSPVLVNGGAALNSAQLTVNRINLPVTQIGGVMKFNNEGLYAEDLQASAFGIPLKATVNTVNRQTLITAEGKTTSQQIADLLKTPALLKANGESSFQVGVTIPPIDEDSPIKTEIKSDLTGIEFDFPGGIRKTKTQAKPLGIAVDLTDKSQIFPVRLNYNNELKAAVKVGLPQQNVVSGHVLLGKGMANFTNSPGINVEIDKTPLALQEYLPLAAVAGGPNSTAVINEIKVNSDSALWDKKRIGNFKLNLKRNSAFWSGDIDSLFAKGVFDIPFDFNKPSPAVLAMDMLDLSALRQFNSGIKGTPGNFNIIPNVRSKKTLWRNVDLGTLALETEKTPFGIKLRRLSIEGQDETLEAKGDWQNNNGSSVTAIQGKISMRRADELFSKLNITKDFTQTSGNVNFQLNWHASPWQLTLPDMRGNMAVKLNSGRILSIEPGFGRILGIVALEQWIKRLELDFSDIFAEGLTFNSIKGDFNLSHGKASTQNLFIDSVPAKITITGDTDYVNQTLDHLVKVVPKSLDAVPIAGTIMSKIADFLGKTITGKNQEGFFMGKQYTVKGGWYEAEIKPLHKNDGILQKTWTNLTGGE